MFSNSYAYYQVLCFFSLLYLHKIIIIFVGNENIFPANLKYLIITSNYHFRYHFNKVVILFILKTPGFLTVHKSCEIQKNGKNESYKLNFIIHYSITKFPHRPTVFAKSATLQKRFRNGSKLGYIIVQNRLQFNSVNC